MRCRGSRRAGPLGVRPFPYDTDYFGDPKQQWTVNFRVRNLNAMMMQLRAAGIRVDLDPSNSEWPLLHVFMIPKGNPVELSETCGRDPPS